MEAEYMALCEACKEGVWLSELIRDIVARVSPQDHNSETLVIRVDNNGCIDLSNNPVEHKRMKHIHIRYHYVREFILAGKVTLEYCANYDMMADPMTKAVAKLKHAEHVQGMGMC